MPDLGQLCFAITLLIAYLYSNNGISREVTNGILTIFSVILTILQSIVGHEPQKSSHSLSTIPHDVRSALKMLEVLPTVYRSICCPQCYSQYDMNIEERHCQQSSTEHHGICGATLHRPDGRPHKIFTTQSFTQWLHSFASRCGYMELLESCRTRQTGRSSPDTMKDVWDSRIWQEMKDETGQPFMASTGSLGFTLFVDWFNPLGNKAAGKDMLTLPTYDYVHAIFMLTVSNL